MKPMLDKYYREVEAKAEDIAEGEDMREREDHLRAFPLGRIVQRADNPWHNAWRRVGWLLAGLTIGTAFGIVYPDHVYPALAQKFLTKARLLARGGGKLGLLKFWKMPRLRA